MAFSFELLNRTLLPSPLSAIGRFFDIIVSGNILPDLSITLQRMAAGYVLASAIGIPLGLLMGYFLTVFRLFQIPLDFFRSLPVTTLYPLFVLMFGIGHASKIAMVFVASVFVIVLNSAYGVMQSSKIRRQMSQLFGASSFQVFRLVVFYDALPQTLIGLRVAVSYSLIVEIVCEMFMGTQRGIGQRVFEAYNTYSISELYALALLVGLLGYGLNQIFVISEKRLAHWVV